MPSTALEKLKQMTAWTSEPELTEDDLAKSLASSARLDANGYTPADEEWIPTYDLNKAAAAAWLVKAARAAALIEMDPPGSGILTSKVFDNCRVMARIYAGKRSVTLTTR